MHVLDVRKVIRLLHASSAQCGFGYPYTLLPATEMEVILDKYKDILHMHFRE